MKKLLCLFAICAFALSSCSEKEQGGSSANVFTDEAVMSDGYVEFHGHMSDFLSQKVSAASDIFFLVTQTSGNYDEGSVVKVYCLKREGKKFSGRTGTLKPGILIYYKAFVEGNGKIYSGEEKSFQLPVDKVKADVELFCLDEGATRQLKFSWTPSTAPKPAVKYEIEDESIASIDAAGVVTGLKKGKTTLKIVPDGGGNPDWCNIVVRAHYDILSKSVVDLGLSVLWAEEDTKGQYSWSVAMAAGLNTSTLRLPTKAEFEELFKYTTPSYEIRDGVPGVMLTSHLLQNEDSTYPFIFIPLKGYSVGGKLYDKDYSAILWTSESGTAQTTVAWAGFFDYNSNVRVQVAEYSKEYVASTRQVVG